MVRSSILVMVAVLGLAFSAVRAGHSRATVTIIERVDSFAEWSVAEIPSAVVTPISQRSLRIQQTMTLLANTDASLELVPDASGGVLTSADGDVLQTAWGLTGNVELTSPSARAGEGSIYRLCHMPGVGKYDVTIDMLITAPEEMTVVGARCTPTVEHRSQNSQRVDTTFEVTTGTRGLPESKIYSCGFSLTASW